MCEKVIRVQRLPALSPWSDSLALSPAARFSTQCGSVVLGQQRGALAIPYPPMNAPNQLQRNFTTHAPNEAWVTDVKHVRTDEGWLYLAPVIESFFSTLHFELLSHRRFERFEDARSVIPEWIDGFYNPRGGTQTTATSARSNMNCVGECVRN